VIYFFRRVGNLFKHFGLPPDKVLVVVGVSEAKEKKDVAAYTVKDPKIVYINYNTQESQKRIMQLAKEGFLVDMYVGNEYDLIKEIFDMKKGRS
jgi:hypothetical protein